MNHKKRLLKRLVWYTLGVFAIQWVYLLGIISQPVAQSNLIVKVSGLVFHSPIVIFEWALFLLAQLSLSAAFIAFIYSLARGTKHAFRLSNQKAEVCGIGYWYLGILTIFCANTVLFPYSIFSPSIYPSFFFYMGIIGISMIAGIVLLAIYGLWCYIKWRIFAILGLLGSALAIVTLPFHVAHAKSPHSVQPNIIIIGIDSLRYDVLHDPTLSAHLPHLRAFFSASSEFSEATTPLARTYPSWLSVLTGSYPKHTHGRHTLMPFNQINMQDSLVRRLKVRGYDTFLGFDERRFSPLNQQYGFDHVIIPKTGFNDFFLGTVNDFPMSNLVVNTSFGKWLFPYSYANHGATKTYRPETFTQYLAESTRDLMRPAFMAIHLCLAHWPYYWANAPYQHLMHDPNNYKAYIACLEKADEQFGEIMANLQKQGFLKNAIVIVFSDHGQSFQGTKDNLLSQFQYIGHPIPLALQKQLTYQEEGHGTMLTEEAQSHVVLGFQRYGSLPFPEGKIEEPASLVDIAPTLLSLVQADHHTMMDGISLVPYLEGYKKTARNIYMESGFTLSGILTAKKSIQKILDDGVNYVGLYPDSGEVFVRSFFTPLIVKGKQRAIRHYPWIVLTYPLNAHVVVPVAINLKQKKWTVDMESPWIYDSPVPQLLTQLQHFYGNEIPKRLYRVSTDQLFLPSSTLS